MMVLDIKKVIGYGFRYSKKLKFSLKPYMSTNHAFLSFKKLHQQCLWKIKSDVENFIFRTKIIFYTTTTKTVTTNKLQLLF